ncbi:hypothetical protein ACN47E_008225 [Coniothyrium glycines]
MHVRSPASLRHSIVLSLLSSVVHALPDTALCGQYENVTDLSNTYTFSTNVWGMDNSGASCIEVYDNATTLSSTWAWRANESLVHAYPNVNYNPIQRDPIPLSNLSSLDVKVSWSMKPELSTSSQGLDVDGLSLLNAKTNVAIDVFFDAEIERAVNTTAPRHEIMVWLGKFGSILPIGATASADTKQLPKMKLGKEEFTLYQGPNDNGQQVYSWVAGSNQTVFEEDISPLVHYLWRNGLVLAANYIGVIQIGTEQKHSTSNVSFFMGDFAISATRGTPKEAGSISTRIPSSTLASDTCGSG